MDIYCPFCKSKFVVQDADKDAHIQFCPACGQDLQQKPPSQQTTISEGMNHSNGISLVQGHAPREEGVQFSIGPYQVLRSIGKGGMGEVFLAYDTTCGRRIALKRIREDLTEHQLIHSRFLKEARITSQLTHPAIIPIYAIHDEDNLIYYTMPFVEGETLKQIFRETKKQEKSGETRHHLGSSIPSLMRIFLTICQAVAYAHSKGVLHRDLKPENIIVGTYGEVLILDWGLAKLIRTKPQTENYPEVPEGENSLHQLTHIGKVVGTISYMAPERGMGQPATVKTDIYSLGVILYQILTLRLPFRRPSLKEFRLNMHKEQLFDPVEIAPYREVPRFLSGVVLKCLAVDPKQRYHTVDELIHDIESYIEGRSEWFEIAELNIDNKNDWEFQENILIAEHIAITRAPEIADWVSLMISQKSFPENIMIETRVRLGEKGHGLGIMLSIPEAAERVHINDGYCLWIGSDVTKTTKLLRSTVEVFQAKDVFLQRHEWYRIRIEKIENNIHLYINDTLQFSYISHLPLPGTHIGLLSRDGDFALSSIKVFSGSQSINVSCLAVPDAFLAHKDYATALNEYRRIGYSFPGRAEGREAMFRAGITLLEQARDCKKPEEAQKYYDQALEEFGKLHATPGAPLEYLGKALVYQDLKDYEEEVKCYELAYRRYPAHPLLPLLNEHVLYRMHESSRSNRYVTYNFILLATRYIPNISKNSNAHKLFSNLQKHWEPLNFLEEDPDSIHKSEIKNMAFGVPLAFWTAKPFILVEFIDKIIKYGHTDPIQGEITMGNALFALVELGAINLAKENLAKIRGKLSQENLEKCAIDLDLIGLAAGSKERPLEDIAQECFAFFPKGSHLSKKEMRVIFYLMRQALSEQNPQVIHALAHKLEDYNLPADAGFRLDAHRITAFLVEGKTAEAEEIFHKYPLELLDQETTPLHFLYSTWLYLTEGKEIAQIHFSGVLEVSYPRTWTLGTHYLNGKITENGSWFKKSFMWERRQLFRQLAFFYHCIGETQKAAEFLRQEGSCYLEEGTEGGNCRSP